MLESQIDQHERKRVLENDRKVREGGTMHAHALADAETPRGRFSAISNAYVVGSKPMIASSYPACSPALAVQLPDEPPLGLDNPALLEPSVLAEAQGNSSGAVAPSVPLDVERTAPSLSFGDPTSEVLTPSISQPQRVGSPAYRRY